MLTKAIEEWETTTTYNIDKLTKAILSSVVFVAKYLLAQKAVLLPWVCHVFLQVYNVQYTDINSVQVSLELKDSSVQFSSRWLLHQLIVHLDAYMMHKCVHMKYGTVLYRKGADILATLSWALSTSNLAGQWSKPEKQKQHDNYPNAETTLKEASIIMNNLIHDEIKRSVEMTSTLDYNSLKIKEHLKNINPLLLHFLFNQFILQHYKAGTSEVHLIFDKVYRQLFNPKRFEHVKRYSKNSSDHQHCSFIPEANVPNKWQEYLQCQQCKRSIVEAVGLALLQKGRYFLVGQQRLLLAGCFSGKGENNAWLLKEGEVSAEQPEQYYSTAQEADSRIWRHAMQSQATNILIYSPDTDVYNIGLSFLNQHPTATYIIQLNIPHADEKKYINLNNLKMALSKDTDLSNVPQDEVCLILQTLFICTGCDYISYIKSIGKATVLNNFFQHASFICGYNMPGFLHNTSLNNRENGFLSFIRFIGTCYFKKHLSAFVALKGHKIPTHLYNSLDPSLQMTEKHKQWLQQIREVVGDRIINEEDRVPTFTSLWRHWLRSCWISQMWQRSSYPDIFSTLPAPELSGWVLQSDNNYVIDWESPEVQLNIRHNIEFLTKECSCKKGCKTLQCGCRKRSRNCGPGCLCQGCTNVNTEELESLPNDDASSSCDETDDEETSESEYDNGEQLEEEIITDDFYFSTYDIV